jgi:hypothetical protein
MGLFKAKRQIGPETVLQRKADLLFSQIDGEVVMLSIENNEYYGMDKVGSRIWELLEHPVSLRRLVDKLMEEYDVSEGHCIVDTLEYLKKLEDRKLLLIE